MTTNFIKTSLFAFFFGLRDSLLGAVTLLYIDKDTDDTRTSRGEKYDENERPPGRRGPRPRQGKEYVYNGEIITSLTWLLPFLS